MNDQIKKPRKILGNGSNIEFVNSTKNLNGASDYPTQPEQIQLLQQSSHLLNNSSSCGNNISYTTSANNLQQLQQQQQEQMERIRLMNQEMHAMWPYGTTTFLSPMLPAHNVAVPYALAGTLPYAAVPIYQTIPNGNPQQCNISPVSSSSSTSTSATTAGAQQQQQQQSQNLLRSNLPTNNNNNNNNNSTVGGTASINQNSLNDSNKINIQIGLQCISQNAPLNVNSMNDALAKVNLFNFCQTSNQVVEKDNNKESNPSLPSSPILLTPDDNTAITHGAGGDATNINTPGSNNVTVTLSQAKFNELTRLALRGSEIAEKLAYTHRNRPCFKKIDSLCARMKQDLIRPDGVLPNINSQGIAWAVKDFIFVFTRVINAWIIIKGYVYNTPEGLNKVKAALSPDFVGSFAAWQDTTMDFIENLIKSFVNLDNLVQSQKNVYQKSDNGAAAGTRNSNNTNTTTPIKILQPGNPLLDDAFDFLNISNEKSQQISLNKNYIYTMVEDSEGSQRQATANGTYFKTGTYNPIKKEVLQTEQPTTDVDPTPPSNINNIPSTSNHLLTTNSATLEQYLDEHLSKYWTPATVNNNQATPVNTIADDSFTCLKIKEKDFKANWLNYDVRVLEQNLAENSSDDCDPKGPPCPVDKELNQDKLNIMLERILCMKTDDMFFKLQFTKNYFPDFIAKHKNDFIDVRSIILKCETGGYQNIYEMVHDVKKIIYYGKDFLKVNNDAKLQKSITAFEMEFNELLSEEPFENLKLENITGGEQNEI